jgi:phosphatidylcholine synthase
MTSLRGLTLTLSAVWAVTYAVLLLQFPDPNPWVVALSLGYLVYYAGLSGYLTLRNRSAQRGQPVR